MSSWFKEKGFEAFLGKSGGIETEVEAKANIERSRSFYAVNIT